MGSLNQSKDPRSFEETVMKKHLINLLGIVTFTLCSHAARAAEAIAGEANPVENNQAETDDANATENSDDSAAAEAQYHDDADLKANGEWVEFGGKQCWHPVGIAAGWRPYGEGYWVETEAGLAWNSEEAWAAITYHYGNWVNAPELGWVWTPGTVWAPAWVAWRHGEGFTGWAPLPPVVGLQVTDSVVLGIQPAAFCFVENRFVADRYVYNHVVSVERNTTIISHTTNITHYNVTRVNGRTVVNNHATLAHVNRATGQHFQHMKTQVAHNAAEARQISRKGGVPLIAHSTAAERKASSAGARRNTAAGGAKTESGARASHSPSGHSSSASHQTSKTATSHGENTHSKPHSAPPTSSPQHNPPSRKYAPSQSRPAPAREAPHHTTSGGGSHRHK
jgi:hypothetical protein